MNCDGAISAVPDAVKDVAVSWHGDTVADMMRYVHLDVEGFQQSYAQLVSAKIAADEQQSVLDELQSGLDGYTYLEEL